MKRRQIGVLAVTVFVIFIILLFGPMDVFSHGFYCDVVEYDQIDEQGRLGHVDLQKGYFEMEFAPVKNHFAGFEINLIKQPDVNAGTLKFLIYNDRGKMVDVIEADLSKIKAAEWYRLYSNKTLKRGKTYILQISAESCKSVPYLQIVDPDYLTGENCSGDILLVLYPASF